MMQDRNLLLRDGNGDVAIGDYAVVVSLQIERPRLGLIAVKSASGRTRKFGIVVIRFTIAQNCYLPANESYVKAGQLFEAIF